MTTDVNPEMPTVALFTNYIHPYRASLFRALSSQALTLRIYTSLPTDSRRRAQNWRHLDVVQQRAWTFAARERHPLGFLDGSRIVIPIDTEWHLARSRPDVIVSGEFGFCTLQTALYCVLTRRTRLIIWATLSEHTEQGRGLLRLLARRMFLRCADAVLVNGGSGANYIRRLGFPSERIFFAPYTTAMEPFLATSLTRPPCRAHRLLYVGQLIERKGLLQFFACLARWGTAHPAHSVEFWVVGEGSLRQDLEHFSLPPNVSVSFFGSVAYQELPQMYAAAGIFVLPTLADEWAVVVNEALASGLPILGSVYSQAVNELVSNGINGWTFRTNVNADVDRALNEALAMPVSDLDELRVNSRSAIAPLVPEAVAGRIAAAVRFVRSRPRR